VTRRYEVGDRVVHHGRNAAVVATNSFAIRIQYDDEAYESNDGGLVVLMSEVQPWDEAERADVDVSVTYTVWYQSGGASNPWRVYAADYETVEAASDVVRESRASSVKLSWRLTREINVTASRSEPVDVR